MATTHYQLVSSNKRRSFIIMALFILFTAGASYLMALAFGYELNIVAVALIFSGITTFIGYWWSDKIILGISRAKPATREEFFDFYTTVENIALGQGMPMPKLYVIEDSAINAFATGRNPENGVVCATTGLLSRLNRSEIEGVMAHEMSHIQNYDILLMSVVTVLVGLVALLSDWFLRMSFFGGRRRRSNDKGGGQIQFILIIVGLLLALLSPLIAQLIKLALSRRREHLADSSAVAMTRNPEGLARALEKISLDKEPLEAANKATAHLYIANPLKNHHDAIGWFAGLFSTHPPIKERVANLRGMTGQV
jgi:heat shock protein HtpX